MPARPATKVHDDETERTQVVAEVSVPLQRQGRPAVRHSTRPDLVARIVELASQGRGTIVVGDAGVGKTHLVNLVVPQLTAAGARIVTVTATAARRAMPLGALEPLLGDVDLLGASAARTGAAVLRSLRTVPDGGAE